MANKLDFVAALCLVAVLVLAGCGGPDDNRAHVTGRVTVDGAPINEGAVNLVPLSPDGLRVGGPISQGVYEIPRERGPVPGKYRVEIFAFEPINPPSGSEEGDAEADSATRQVLPPKFNAESELELDVDSAKVEKDFELTTS